MFGIRWLRWAVRSLLGLVAALPVGAVAIAAVIDFGPDGEGRISALPIALRVSSDFTWTCARNSLTFAGLIAALSLVLGLGIGRTLAAIPGRGRALARVAVGTILAAPPACLALGWIGLLAWPLHWPLAMRRAVVGIPALESLAGWPSWLLWIASTAPPVVALVALATARAFEEIDPEWTAAARLAGAGRFAAWRSVTWPIVRPAAARAAAAAFALALLEPGVPILLGLRRTLAFQIVEAATGSDPFPATAIWAVFAAILSFAGRWLLRSWGGPRPIGSRTISRHSSTGPVTTIAAASIVTVTSALGWLPVFGCLALLISSGANQSILMETIASEPVREAATRSLVLGLEVGAAVLILAWLARPEPSPRGSSAPLSRVSRRLARVPPMIQGVGLLAVLELLAHRLEPAIGFELSAERNPWPLLASAVGISVGSQLLAGWWQAEGQRLERARSSVDAAILAGASPARARSLAARHRLGWLGVLSLAILLPAVNLVPALFFCPWTDVRPMAPEFLILAESNPRAQTQAAALACGLIVLNLVALAASRLSPAPPPEWETQPD